MSYNNIKLFQISDHYMDYMVNILNDPSSGKTPVYMNHNGRHTRKYLLLNILINGFNYYIPLSSGRRSDYKINSRTGLEEVRSNSLVNWRISEINQNGKNEVLASIIFSSMIPAPESVVSIYLLDQEQDVNYRNLVLKEIRYISANKDAIIKNALRLYQQKTTNLRINYLDYTVDFILAEQSSLRYVPPT